MNRLTLTIFFFFLSVTFAFAQKTTKHKVVSGDSFYSIAKKYDVSENDIYELNPKLKGQTLQLNTVLIIPTNKSGNKSNSKTKEDFHTVSSGESFYSIAKKYDISMEDLKKFNPTISPEKLQLGTKLALTKNNSTNSKSKNEKEDKNNTSSDIIHNVKKGETISHISDKYDVSFKQLKKLNPGLSTSLQINQKIVITKGKEKAKKEVIEPKVQAIKVISPTTVQQENMAAGEDDVEEPDDSGEITHVVARGETLMSISRKYAITLEKLRELNPKVGDRIFPGRKLIIKKGTVYAITTPVVYAEMEEFVEDAPERSYESLENADQLIAIASEHLGTRYRSGGTKSGGFDCSGLMCYTFEQIDLKLPRTSNEQSRTGRKIKRKQAQKGDLIFFSTNGRGTVNHVGMITEVVDDEIFFIHSSSSRGVVVSSLNESYYSRRFKRINRVLD